MTREREESRPASADEADGTYDVLRSRFGGASPKASGYRSGSSFYRERDLVLAVVGEAPPGAVLDLACGSGLVSEPLVHRGVSVVGIDYNAAACAQARRGGILSARGDAFELPLADAAFDTALSVEFAQQYEPAAVQRLLAEAGRVLRPGGRLVLVWRNGRSWLHRSVHPVFALVDRLTGRAPLALHDHAPDEVTGWARVAGLVPERVAVLFPPLRWQSERLDGLPARLLGTSFLAVLRATSEDGPGSA